MKKSLYGAAAATAILFGLAGVSNAATVAFSALPTVGMMNPLADSVTGTVYQNVIGSVTNQYRSPWEETGTDTGVMTNDADAFLTSVSGNATATYNVGKSVSTSFVWGSPDTYNKLEFLLGGVVVDSLVLTASQTILPATFGGNGALAMITGITGGIFDTLRFSSGQTNAFEFANLTVAPVPLPAAGLMLMTAFGGFAALRSRRKSA